MAPGLVLGVTAMDDATLDRLADAAWDLRCQRMAEAEDGPKFMPGTYAARAEDLKATDRAVVALIAAEIAAWLEHRAGRRVPGIVRKALVDAARDLGADLETEDDHTLWELKRKAESMAADKDPVVASCGRQVLAVGGWAAPGSQERGDEDEALFPFPEAT